jgi:hypothetical protein
MLRADGCGDISIYFESKATAAKSATRVERLRSDTTEGRAKSRCADIPVNPK